MEKKDIHTKVSAIIAERLGVKASQITRSTRFIEDLGADSLDSLDLLMGINEEFGITIPAEKLPEILTVQDMIDQINKPH